MPAPALAARSLETQGTTPRRMRTEGWVEWGGLGWGRKQQFEAQIHSEGSGAQGIETAGGPAPTPSPCPGEDMAALRESSPRLPLPWM